MKIRGLTVTRGQFAAEGRIDFHPGVNIIRGPNGIGKTTILEYASLLGHVCAMQFAPPSMSGPDVALAVSLSSSDRAFLAGLNDCDENDPDIREYDRVLKTVGSSLKSLLELPVPEGEFELAFTYEPLQAVDSLKDVLADEARIREHVRVHGDPKAIELVRALNLWSRPVPMGRWDSPENIVWSITPRYRRIEFGSPCSPEPARIFYVNTDMYEFGTGLDIRESPKHLKEKITPIMVNRLQLVTCNRLPPEGNHLSDGFTDGEKGFLVCEASLRKAWKDLFVKYHQFESGSLTCSISRSWRRERRTFIWEFKVGGEDRSTFLSSGENQALFLLAMLHGLATEGSCMLLDEPELHLTFRAGSLLMTHILERAHDLKSQAIIVTHLPHLYRHAITTQKDPWRKEEGYDYSRIRMIHMGGEEGESQITYDHTAVDAAARYAHADVIALVRGLHVAEVKVWPPRDEWKSWLSLFKRRKKRTRARRPTRAEPPSSTV